MGASAAVVAGASASSVADPSLAFWGDWGGWVASNVIVGALAPVVLMGILHLIKLMLGNALQINYKAAYKDGQLGFVSLGWIAGAWAEIIKSMTSGPIYRWHAFSILILLLPAFFSALCATVGSIPAGQPPAAGAAPPPNNRRLIFWLSFCLAVLSLGAAGAVHYAVS